MQVFEANIDGIEAALNILRTGGIVAHATETCYGLACDLQNPEAVARLFAIKQRPDTMPVSALFASVEQAQAFLEWNDEASHLASEHLPGPLTIILKQRPDAPHHLHVIPNTKYQIPLSVSVYPPTPLLASWSNHSALRSPPPQPISTDSQIPTP